MKVPADSGRGKRGPFIYQGGRYGHISRALTIPTNPNTPSQLAARDRLARVASCWSQLPPPAREAWKLAAQQLQVERPLERAKSLRGLELFARINCARLIIGLPETMPPPPRPAFGPLAVTRLVITHTGGTVALKLGVSGVPAGDTILWAAPPCSQGRENPFWVAYLETLPPPVDDTIDITAPYLARFGAPPTGSKVFVRVNQNSDGWQDTPQQFYAIVPPKP